MGIDVFKFITSALDPVERIIDSVHTSDEERMQLQAEVTKVKNSFSGQLLQYESEILQSKSRIIVAEAQGQSWIQKSWRPIAMLTFLVLVVCDSFGLLAFRLSDQAWELLKIGLGGYVVGRSAEKIAPQVVAAFSGKRSGGF
ncbi:MAG: 3TM-type holin [Pseudohongiellaceae bacterium]|nr:3TM-type holin [Pseudohongiellaceae bacterium]